MLDLLLPDRSSCLLVTVLMQAAGTIVSADGALMIADCSCLIKQKVYMKERVFIIIGHLETRLFLIG